MASRSLADNARQWLTRHRPDPDAVAAWATELLHRATTAGPIPVAGSAAWAALPDHDPRKPAAIVRTALAALRESTPDAVAQRVAAEWAASQREFRQRLKDASVDMSAAQDWGKVAGHLPFCVYAARRTTYATEPLTVEQIRAQASIPWACDRARRDALGSVAA
ncbi:DUF2742 domain-containing protein [Umezawaea sp. Da 62-37]|uniref:DUF2742 domain-containing protein n=1 Tax=Umezawaea sp. Da 62-37 TaxID=3075927 RepID=UPI0028F73F26|nr:DUF2742 domain-containing protein [Umezawaea sp. Da 62-37]WNV90951.1 DUF2742 domain-containing protein [Umezawaea sp. Da 62-37]